MNRKHYLNEAMRQFTNNENYIEEEIENTKMNEITVVK